MCDTAMPYVQYGDQNMWLQFGPYGLYYQAKANAAFAAGPWSTQVAPIKLPHLCVREIRMTMRDWTCDDAAAKCGAHYPLMVKICSVRNRSLAADTREQEVDVRRNGQNSWSTKLPQWDLSCGISTQCSILPQGVPFYLPGNTTPTWWNCRRLGHRKSICNVSSDQRSRNAWEKRRKKWNPEQGPWTWQ